jgi:hypothetical protein
VRKKERRTIWCACGCKTALETPDSEGRERRFISGHNGRKYSGREATSWGRNKRWHKKHPETIREGKRRFHRRRKVKAILYLGGECWFCGLKYDGENAAAFEFHHRNPKTKKYNLGQKMHNRTWESVLPELGKCSLTCANCHHIHHGGKF